MKSKSFRGIAFLLCVAMLSSMFIGLALQTNVSAATTNTFGYSNIGSYPNNTPVGEKDSSRYQAPQSGTINSISMYIQTAGAKVIYGVYSDLNGAPNQLLAQTSPISTGTGNSWVTGQLTVPVVAGRYYWLTIMALTAPVNWKCAIGGAAVNGYDGTTLSSSYGSLVNWGATKFSMYATYATSGATTTATPTPSPTTSPTATPSPTSVPTLTPTPKPTITSTPTPKPTITPTPTSTPSPTPIPSGVQPVWSSDARISSLSQLGIQYGVHGNGSPNDAVTIVTAPNGVSPSGTRAFKLYTDDKRIELDLYPPSSITNDFYFSFWEYIPSSVQANTAAGEWLLNFELQANNIINGQNTWQPIFELTPQGWWGSGTRISYQYVGGAMGDYGNTGATLPRDQWVHFEWYTHIGTNGRITLWMNGQQIADVTGIDTSAVSNNMYFLPCLYGTNGAIYLDKMSLYNVNMNGKAP